jgi:hypothetical protein
MEEGNGEASTNRRSRVRLLTLILILLILVPIILSVFFYYLPLNDVEVTVDKTFRDRYDEGNCAIGFRLNVTNNGIISHYIGLTVKVIFDSQPDMVFTRTTFSYGPIDASETWRGFHVLVAVPDEVFQDPYEASCSVTLAPLVNQYNRGLIVLFAVVWLVGLAAVSTSLVRSRRKR